MNYSLSDLEARATISQGQADDLKIETKQYRVWLSRMTEADGMPYNNQVTVEQFNSVSGNWLTVDEYQAI